MEFRIARPSAAHIPRIAEIWRTGWNDAHVGLVPESLVRLRTPESFLERAHENAADTRMAIVGKDVLGFCMIKRDELYQMYVAPQGRGTGVARGLIGEAEDRMRADGHDKAWLACAVGNIRAMRFYEKTGWHNMGRETVQLDTGGEPFALQVWRYEKSLGKRA